MFQRKAPRKSLRQLPLARHPEYSYHNQRHRYSYHNQCHNLTQVWGYPSPSILPFLTDLRSERDQHAESAKILHTTGISSPLPLRAFRTFRTWAECRSFVGTLLRLHVILEKTRRPPHRKDVGCRVDCGKGIGESWEGLRRKTKTKTPSTETTYTNTSKVHCTMETYIKSRFISCHFQVPSMRLKVMKK